jgi:hypothetical protein
MSAVVLIAGGIIIICLSAIIANWLYSAMGDDDEEE